MGQVDPSYPSGAMPWTRGFARTIITLRPIGVASMDVGAWLRGLGLGQYEASFRGNEIDADVLPELTDQHLKDLGVSLGHRLKMLRAIRELACDAPVKAQPAAVAEPKHQDTAERRQLTVLFSDLVGSTAFSARLDPEDVREIVGAYHRCCADLITKAGGFVAKYMGDGVLAYFGYPQAHEHDAERAVRAGLALVEALPKLTTAAGVPLQVRVGIATGLVVVGDLIGSGEAQGRGVVGETPNLRVCNRSPSRTWSSSPRARAGCSAISSSFRTSGRRTSRASPGRRGP